MGTIKFTKGQFVVYPSFPGIGVVYGEDDKCVSLLYNKDNIKKISKIIPVDEPFSTKIREATEEEKGAENIRMFFDNHSHSDQIKVYLKWLRGAGQEGVMNDCSCEKDQFYNHTCTCQTMVKLYHRFSVFKNDLIGQGYKIDDVETDSGKHKTILVSEPDAIVRIN